MGLAKYRHSSIFRITAFLILLNFLTSQTLYAQEYHVQEGTHLYTPVAEAVAKRAEKGVAKTFLKVFVAETLQRCGVNATKSDFFKNSC